MLEGLSGINIELTSRCNKSCWMCGRRKVEPDAGDMEYEMVADLSHQIPGGVVVQFHNNGEPLLYPHLTEVLGAFQHTIRCLDTNGKLLVEKANALIGNMETITISTFKDDPEGYEQYHMIEAFLAIKKSRKPNVIIRCLGNDPYFYEAMGQTVIRTLHSPMGSFDYDKKPTVPEIGICLEALHHLSIDRKGNVSMCVRFDPEGRGILGNIAETPLNEIWEGSKRKEYLAHHVAGGRASVPLCDKCDYWGVPTG